MIQRHPPPAILIDLISELIGEVKQNEIEVASTVKVRPGLDMVADAAELCRIADDLRGGLLNVVVAGTFNNGKSTLVNALLGIEAVKMGAVPTTGVLTRITQGDSQNITVHYRVGSPQEISWDTYIHTYDVASAHQSGEDTKFQDVEYIEISYPFSLLEPGVTIIDSPGLGEDRFRTGLALEYLPRATAILLVLDATHPFSKEERDFIALLGINKLTNVFFVVNKAEMISDADWESFQEWIIKQIQPYFREPNGQIDTNLLTNRLFFVSALKAVDALQKSPYDEQVYLASNVGALRNVLVDYLRIDAHLEVRLRSAVPILLDLYYRAGKVVDARLETLSAPIETLKQRLEATTNRVTTMLQAVDMIQARIRETGDVIRYQVYGDLLQFIEEMQRTWELDVQSLDLDGLSNTNIFSVSYSKKEQQQLAKQLAEVVDQYLHNKLLQWARRLPDKFQDSLQRLASDVEGDLKLFDLELEELSRWFNGGTFTNDSVKGRMIDVSIFTRIFEADSIFRFIRPLLGQITGDWKNNQTVMTIAITTITHVLTLGATIVARTGPIGAAVSVVMAIGSSVFTQMQRRIEINQLQGNTNQQQLDAAFADLGDDKVQHLQKVVRKMLADEVRVDLFDKIRIRLVAQRAELFDQLEKEFQLISKQVGDGLREKVDVVASAQKRLYEIRNEQEFNINSERTRLKTILELLRGYLDELTQVAVNRVFTDDEISLLSEHRAVFLEKNTAESVVTQVVTIDNTPNTIVNTEPYTAFSTDLLKKRLAIIVAKAVGVGDSAVEDDGIADISDELAEMIGLESIKTRLLDLMARQTDMIERRQHGLKTDDAPRLHLVFTGNPGTGKTTVAKLIGRLYRKMGLLSRGHVITAKREIMVADVIGGTERNMRQLLSKSKGGILFIDEAHQLTPKDSPRDFGPIAVQMLLQAMLNNSDFAVIVAGYPIEMRSFLAFDPGLASRFPPSNVIHFSDYLPDQLFAILEKYLTKRDYTLSPTANEQIAKVISGMYMQRTETFGNARDVENLAQSLIDCHSTRRRKQRLPLETPIEAEDLTENYRRYIQPELTVTSLDDALAGLNSMIGLKSLKETINRWANKARMMQRLGEVNRDPLHMIFQGPPGTGKTTVARKMGEILHAIGFLNTSEVIFVSRDSLVGNVIGETERKTREVLDSARDRVLFIDEAYMLYIPGSYAMSDFGHIVIDMLTAYMTNPDYMHRMVVILAGYTEPMQALLDSNEGLRGRFRTPLTFEPYTVEELLQIARKVANDDGYSLTPEIEARISLYLERQRQNDEERFPNARAVESLLREMRERLYDRIATMNINDDVELQRIAKIFEIEDMPPVPALVIHPKKTRGSVIKLRGEGLDGDITVLTAGASEMEAEAIQLPIILSPPAADRSR